MSTQINVKAFSVNNQTSKLKEQTVLQSHWQSQVSNYSKNKFGLLFKAIRQNKSQMFTEFPAQKFQIDLGKSFKFPEWTRSLFTLVWLVIFIVFSEISHLSMLQF